MSVVSQLTAKGGPVDLARQLATAVGARPYRVFLAWERWPSGEVGEGAHQGPVLYEIRPRPKVAGYASISRNPTVIGVVPTGILRVEEVPLWLPFEALKGHVHPERGVAMAGPERGIKFWYQVDVDEARDLSFQPQRFRLSGEPERDEERAQWILVLERQASQDQR